MTPCPKCGALSDGNFCPKCGAPVVAQAAPSYQPQQPPQQPQVPYPQLPPQYPGIQYTAPPPPKPQGNLWLKWLLGIGGGLIGAVVLLIVLATFFTDSTPAPTDGPGTAITKAVGPITITDQVDSQTQEPANTLSTVSPRSNVIYAAAQVSLKQGQVLSAQWFVNGNFDKDYAAEVKADKDYAQVWASFNIKPKVKGQPFTTGTYRVILYVDGTAASDAQFTVK